MKSIIIAFILVFFTLNATAQGQYFYKGATSKGTDVTYICEHRGPIVTIINENNRYENVSPKRLDRTRIPNGETIEAAKVGVIREIVNEVFPTLAQTWWDDLRRPSILTTINTNGDVVEMSFVFLTESTWGTISPDKFYQLEQKIKQRMKFALTDSQKKQNIVKAIF